MQVSEEPNRVLEPLKLEFQSTVNWPAWALGTQLRSSVTGSSALNG